MLLFKSSNHGELHQTISYRHQHSMKILKFVASAQQENSQVVSITKEESADNLDLDNGDMSKLL